MTPNESLQVYTVLSSMHVLSFSNVHVVIIGTCSHCFKFLKMCLPFYIQTSIAGFCRSPYVYNLSINVDDVIVVLVLLVLPAVVVVVVVVVGSILTCCIRVKVC